MNKREPVVVIVPGYSNSGPQHWQSLWQEKHPEYLRVEQRDWNNPIKAEWIATLRRFLSEINGPIILVAHSLGCIAVAHWAAENNEKVFGALLVAPADVERPDALPPLRNFSPVPLNLLPFPSIVVASTTDPYVSLWRAEYFAKSWGGRFIIIGPAGHINTDAGFGPWRQGEVLLQQLVQHSG